MASTNGMKEVIMIDVVYPESLATSHLSYWYPSCFWGLLAAWHI